MFCFTTMQQSKVNKTPWRLLVGASAFSLIALSANAAEDSISGDMSPPELFGFMVAQQVGLDQLGFSDEEKTMFLSGMKSGLMGGSMEDIQDKIPELQSFLQERAEAAQAVMAMENEAAAADFVEDLENDPDVVMDDSGFYYEIIEAGSDVKPGMSDEVVVNYKGALIDGTVFDSSYDRGQPATFPMNGVIKGFSGGLSKIGEGGKVRIYIPAELGYGNSPPPQSPIPAGAMLIFDAEIEQVISE